MEPPLPEGGSSPFDMAASLSPNGGCPAGDGTCGADLEDARLFGEEETPPLELPRPWAELLYPLIKEYMHLFPSLFLLLTLLALLITIATKQATDVSREEITRFSYRFMVTALGGCLLLLLIALPITPLYPELRFDTFFTSSRLILLLQAVIAASSLLILAGSDTYLAENR